MPISEYRSRTTDDVRLRRRGDDDSDVETIA